MNGLSCIVLGRFATIATLWAVILFSFGSACRGTESSPTIRHATVAGERLYVQHCTACHGVSGNGKGPGAIALKVWPRDLRNEPFRYVSTLNSVPTQADLIQTIQSGRRIGEMPAHPHLTDAEIRALAAYVRELNRLGWARRLEDEFAGDDEMTPKEIEEIAAERVTPEDPVTVLRPGAAFRADTEVGRELYLASCAACHGSAGTGDGLDKPKDERGRSITVRDLTTGEFRGGTDLEEIFKRIRCGIPGTPMPAQEAWTDEQVWQLVYYVEYLAGRRR